MEFTMRYTLLVTALLFAFAIYAFAIKGAKDMFIVGSEHTMKDYLEDKKIMIQ